MRKHCPGCIRALRLIGEQVVVLAVVLAAVFGLVAGVAYLLGWRP